MNSSDFAPSPPPYKTILVEQDGGVDQLCLNRPEQLNALNSLMVRELLHYFDQLYYDHSTRVVVLTGSGKAFCAGLDLQEVSGAEADQGVDTAVMMQTQRRVSELVIKMRRCPQPIIACVQGAAAGGGFALALASDIRYATPSTKMNAAFIKVGLSACDIGVSYFLPRLVGASVASELLLTGRFIRAERALQVGLVSEVVEAEALQGVAMETAREMLAASPLGLRLTKEELNASLDASSLEATIAMEDRQQVVCGLSSDFMEAVTAFMEKREPRYNN